MNREQLLKTLQAVSPGVARKEMIEQSTCFIFKDGHVISYDDEVSVRVKIDLGFEGAVPAEPFIALLSRLPDEEVKVVNKDDSVQIRGKGKRGTIKKQQEITLPVDNMPKPGKMKKLPKDFGKVISAVSSSASRDMTRPILTAVSIATEGADATDNFQITQMDFESDCPAEFLLPASQAPIIARYNPTHVAAAKGWVHFKNKEGVVFSCRTITGDFPDLSDALGIKGVKVKLPKLTGDALDRTGIFLDAEFDQDRYISITIEEGKMRILSSGSKGSLEEVMKVKYKGKPVSFSVHPQLLSSALSLLRDVVIGKGALLLEGERFSHAVRLMASKEG